MTAWAAFWLFATVFVVCDTWLYSKGHNTFFWEHKTPAELEIQRKQSECCSGDCNQGRTCPAREKKQ